MRRLFSFLYRAIVLDIQIIKTDYLHHFYCFKIFYTLKHIKINFEITPTCFGPIGPSSCYWTTIMPLDHHHAIGPPSCHWTTIMPLDHHHAIGPIVRPLDHYNAIGPPSCHWTTIMPLDHHQAIGPIIRPLDHHHAIGPSSGHWTHHQAIGPSSGSLDHHQGARRSYPKVTTDRLLVRTV